MPDFAIDHIVIRMPDPDGFAGRVAEACGLAVLRGYAPAGVVQSRGLRFANGPFLDIFQADAPATALILHGEVDAAERLAEVQGWRVRLARRSERPPEAPDSPWSMALFRRDQGLLTYVAVIDYAAADDEAWARPDYSGPLYRTAPEAPAQLRRIWLATQDLHRAERDLAALGYVRAGDAVSAFWPHAGRRLSGPAAELILVEGAEQVMRFDVAADASVPVEIISLGAPRVVVGEA